MSDRRDQLSLVLNAISGVKKVYYQPNENSKLEYPCIVYNRDPSFRVHADNILYLTRDRYKVTLIDRKPDSPAFVVLVNLPYSAHESRFVQDGLYHDVFDLYH